MGVRMSKTYILRQAAQLAGVDERTFARWADKAQMQMQRDTIDQRRRIFTAEQVEQLVAQHSHQSGEGKQMGDQNIQNCDSSVQDLAEEVAELKAQLRDLSQQVGQ